MLERPPRLTEEEEEEEADEVDEEEDVQDVAAPDSSCVGKTTKRRLRQSLRWLPSWRKKPQPPLPSVAPDLPQQRQALRFPTVEKPDRGPLTTATRCGGEPC